MNGGKENAYVLTGAQHPQTNGVPRTRILGTP
jgi:hypothetical protein